MKTFIVSMSLLLLIAPAAALADYRTDYNVKCSNCHRQTGRLLKAAKELNVDPGKLVLKTSKMNREEMIAITEKGKDKMPGFEKELTRKQIEDVVDYIIALKNRRIK